MHFSHDEGMVYAGVLLWGYKRIQDVLISQGIIEVISRKSAQLKPFAFIIQINFCETWGFCFV